MITLKDISERLYSEWESLDRSANALNIESLRIHADTISRIQYDLTKLLSELARPGATIENIEAIAAKDAEIAHLRARVAELERALTWRPIEDAPTDGTEVLLFAQLDPPEKWIESIRDLKPFCIVSSYHQDAGWCVCEVREATHYMELPEPPK